MIYIIEANIKEESMRMFSCRNYTSFCDNQMSMNRFTVLSKYDFTNYQIPILIIMTIIAIIVLLRSSVDELEL